MNTTSKLKETALEAIRELRKIAMHEGSAEAVEHLRDIGLAAVGTLDDLHAMEECEADLWPPVLAVAANSEAWPISISAFKEKRRDQADNAAAGIKLGLGLPFDTNRSKRDFAHPSLTAFTVDVLQRIENFRSTNTRPAPEPIPVETTKALKADFQKKFRAMMHHARHDPNELASLENRLEVALQGLEPRWQDAAAAISGDVNEDSIDEYAKAAALMLDQEKFGDWRNVDLPKEIVKRSNENKNGTRYGELRAISDKIKANFKSSLKKDSPRKSLKGK